ncbi:MAG TPA: 50S ribosomal protein L15 [Bacteroidota bacterium]|nr:50S ribosomal protein L15 [Bacteroidota bacterium]
MTLSTLKYADGSRKRTKRIGRGQGSGHGGTATKGHKGQAARTGALNKPWFEGGQMPLIRRVPKFGFHSPFKIDYQVVNVGILEKLAAAGKLPDGNVTLESLHAAGAVAKRSVQVKILGVGELKAKLKVSVHSCSASAKQKIEAAGGSFTSVASEKSN